MIRPEFYFVAKILIAMHYSDFLSGIKHTSNNENSFIHDAFEKKFDRLNKVHQRDLDDLETFYKQQIIFIIKEKDSVSIQLVSILQSLIEYFQHELTKIKPINQNVINISDEKVNVDNEIYQRIINEYKNKQKFLLNQNLELKELILEHKKAKVNISTKMNLLNKENVILKQNLNNKLKNIPRIEMISGFLLWCLAAIFYQKRDNSLKQYKTTQYLHKLILLLIILFWYLVRLEKCGYVLLLNLIVFVIVYFIIF